ncbi:MAG: HI1506-related protein [Chromatiales bacterium]|nr:HI1506-related protein [Chromatiales bacterium]
MAKNQPKEIEGIFVTPKRKHSFRRAGFEFPAEGMGIALDALSKEQLKAIEEEPMLSVERVTFPADEVEAAE